MENDCFTSLVTFDNLIKTCKELYLLCLCTHHYDLSIDTGLSGYSLYTVFVVEPQRNSDETKPPDARGN